MPRPATAASIAGSTRSSRAPRARSDCTDPPVRRRPPVRLEAPRCAASAAETSATPSRSSRCGSGWKRRLLARVAPTAAPDHSPQLDVRAACRHADDRRRAWTRSRPRGRDRGAWAAGAPRGRVIPGGGACGRDDGPRRHAGRRAILHRSGSHAVGAAAPQREHPVDRRARGDGPAGTAPRPAERRSSRHNVLADSSPERRRHRRGRRRRGHEWDQSRGPYAAGSGSIPAAF